MNNKGNLGLGVLSSLFIIVAGFLMLNFILPEIDTARTVLSCSTPSTISDGTKILCLIISGTVPYWIITIFGLAVGGVVSRLNI